MKKLFLSLLLLFPISLICMNDDELNRRMDAFFAQLKGTGTVSSPLSDRRAAEILTASPEPLSEQVRKGYGVEAKRLAADIVGSHMSSITIDENQLMAQMRQQQDLIATNASEMSKDDPSEDSYVRILGENFDLIQDDMPAEELDRRITQLWHQEGERIKKEALAATEKVKNSSFFETFFNANFPGGIQPSDEQKAVLLRVMNNAMRESVERNNTVATLKMKIDYMRKVVAVHKACLAQKAQTSSSSSSSMHHTIQ